MGERYSRRNRIDPDRETQEARDDQDQQDQDQRGNRADPTSQGRPAPQPQQFNRPTLSKSPGRPTAKPAPRTPITTTDKQVIGVVTKINMDAGWAFLRVEDDPDNRYFLHFSCLRGGAGAFEGLKEGDRVECRAVPTDKGMRAVQAKVIT